MWHGELNGRIYVVRNDAGLFQANELGADWVSGWAESLVDAVGEVIEHVASTPVPHGRLPDGLPHGQG